ncbi:MAG TPA: hypothetical protein VJ909_03560 [Prolixibacteraceae bacterium]|nr:hypothetical protein [Prolixibacteraceae bacterium]
MRIKRFTAIMILLLSFSCQNRQVAPTSPESITSNTDKNGSELAVSFYRGTEHNHPTFAIWVEDLQGNFIETLFVTEYVATGVYGHADLGDEKWDNKPGEAQRPATLPYWLHKKGPLGDDEQIVPSPENPMPDAISGATPKGDFKLRTLATGQLPDKFRVLMEINQPWDWNEYWHNNRYPDNAEYKTSCQPALVYAVRVDENEKGREYFLNPIGHSHYDGSTGELFTDITTLTTAKDIVHKVSVTIEE